MPGSGGVPGPGGGAWSRGGVPGPGGVPGGDPPDSYCCGGYASYSNAFLIYFASMLSFETGQHFQRT